ncbi:BON domain-containing protein [Parvibaculum sedimenti]|uniref:BON domain-containing protein n=1 Tax=Parvibaculum sedimenti TaxID=2608632 RepID=A0A6N6VNQ0_9HYPH|nr:type II and III secretion system protein family protein [Parvibaculum sedimenti]KAB7742837.1 BON domain-containing protein [Parvibaculum sedimenti]
MSLVTGKIMSILRASRLLVTMLAACAIAVPANAAVSNADYVKIETGGSGKTSRSVVLGLNKAAIVELPVAARDVLVSDPKVVDAVVRSATRTYLIGLTVGQTNAFFFNDKGQQILDLEIRVERDLTGLRDALRHYLPDAKIDVQAMNDHIVLSGTVANSSDADKARDLAERYVGKTEQVLNMLAVDSKEQVMLKVTVAEMQRNVIKQLGIDLSSALTLGKFAASLVTTNGFSLQGELGGATLKSPLSWRSRRLSIDQTLKAFEEDGIVRTLAEPTLTAISGESAKFLAGGEFPIPVSKDNQGNITVSYKPFGVGLAFTPVVLSEGRISLKISTEVSELTTSGAIVSQGMSIPGLNVRRAETTLELPSGGSLVMAGLLSDKTKQNIDGVPGAKDVPVLGALFRSRDYQKNETELVVVVTPYIVDPTNRKKIALPTDGYAPASDMDTILMGRLNATYGTNGSAPTDKKLKGPVGFVVD